MCLLPKEACVTIKSVSLVNSYRVANFHLYLSEELILKKKKKLYKFLKIMV